jgi:hypothetical protein
MSDLNWIRGMRVNLESKVMQLCGYNIILGPCRFYYSLYMQ